MQITASSGFLRARRRRRAWIWTAGGITGLLLLVLIPEWLELQWLIYPLPRVFVEILQNLFWAFTTSTIFMLFENSVNSGGSLLERYRDIESSVSPLPETMFSNDFMSRPSDPIEAAEYDADLRIASASNSETLQAFVEQWSHTISFDACERTLRDYRDYAESWTQQIARNQLVFSPEGLEDDFERAFEERCTRFLDMLGEFSHRGLRHGPYWVLEEDMGWTSVLEFYDGVDVADEMMSRLEGFMDADPPLLSATQIASDNKFMVNLNSDILHWGFFYSPMGEDEDWATQYGSRELEHPIAQGGAVLERKFWLAPPRLMLTPGMLFALWSEAVNLTHLAAKYNEALELDLQRARGYALGDSGKRPEKSAI